MCLPEQVLDTKHIADVNNPTVLALENNYKKTCY